MTLAPRTPVIIGVGQSIDRIDAQDYHAWSASDLAAAATRAAVADTGADYDILPRLDAIACTRTFEDSRPRPATFGKSSNFPRSIARRLGVAPRYAVWTKGGGNSPQDLVNEFSERIAAGEFDLVLLTGAEAISTVRHAAAQGKTLDFRENVEGQVEDRGPGFTDFADPLTRQYRVASAPLAYAIAENARRNRLGLSREAYAQRMGDLFAPFSAVARTNPNAAWNVPAYTGEELTTASPRNRWIADPYPLRLVARDQVNQGAAVLLASLKMARELKIRDERLVYLHGYARSTEKMLFARPDIGVSPAARRAVRHALASANMDAGDVAAFDFYSCFPIAVFNVAQDELHLAANDPRKLTATGGLPYFGGPGNNYSMHAIAEIVDIARRSDGRPCLVGANGGYLSKYSAGIYSAQARPWQACNSTAMQADLDAVSPDQPLTAFSGEGIVESYTVHHEERRPKFAVVVGRSRTGERFVARSADGDFETAELAHAEDPLGRHVRVAAGSTANAFVFI